MTQNYIYVAPALWLIINWHGATVSSLLLHRLGVSRKRTFAWLAAARAINFDDCGVLGKIVAATYHRQKLKQHNWWSVAETLSLRYKWE